MQGRVIKFNLMGAIFFLLLIITIIIVSIIYVPKLISKNDNNESNGLIKENEEIFNKNNEEKEYKEIVDINGRKVEINMKKCDGTFGYSMNYDIDKFYVEKNNNGIDVYNSLYSDTIYIHVVEINGKYDERIQKLNLDKEVRTRETGVIEYDITNEIINGVDTVCETKRRVDGVFYTYFINKDSNNYLIIQIHCESQFEESIMPIINKMLDTFEINLQIIR